MKLWRHLLAIVLLVAFPANTAFAPCADFIHVAKLHNAYHAVVHKSPGIRERFANDLLTVAVFLKSSAAKIKPEVYDAFGSSESFKEILDEAETLALATIGFQQDNMATIEHIKNIERLAAAFDASDCGTSGSLGAETHDPTPTGGSLQRTRVLQERSALDLAPQTVLLLGGMAALSLALAIFSVRRILSSKTFRRRKFERLPRFPVSFRLPASFADEHGVTHQIEVSAVDVSMGGIKLRWPSAPKSGTPVVLGILETERNGTIAWSNNHFSGVLFEARLTAQELNTLASA